MNRSSPDEPAPDDSPNAKLPDHLENMPDDEWLNKLDLTHAEAMAYLRIKGTVSEEQMILLQNDHDLSHAHLADRYLKGAEPVLTPTTASEASTGQYLDAMEHIEKAQPWVIVNSLKRSKNGKGEDKLT